MLPIVFLPFRKQWPIQQLTIDQGLIKRYRRSSPTGTDPLGPTQDGRESRRKNSIVSYVDVIVLEAERFRLGSCTFRRESRHQQQQQQQQLIHHLETAREHFRPPTKDPKRSTISPAPSSSFSLISTRPALENQSIFSLKRQWPRL